MNNKTSTITTSLSLETIGLITFIVFLVLKLTNVWNISWFWVWFPLWLPIAISLGIIVIILLICLIVAFVSNRKH